MIISQSEQNVYDVVRYQNRKCMMLFAIRKYMMLFGIGKYMM